jgi:SEC-C motif domain protein
MQAKKTDGQDAADACPCGSGGGYEACCGRYLEGDLLPGTAEQLMRSRYTAFTLARADYLRDTWHTSTRPPSIGFDPAQHWLGLKILSTQEGSAVDVQGWVEFVARSKSGGRAHRLHERSRFVREGGRWYYVDGYIK